jgi:hypothetical protein
MVLKFLRLIVKLRLRHTILLLKYSVLYVQVIASKIRIIMNYKFEKLFKEGGCQNFKVLILNFPKGNEENDTLFGIAGL